MKRSRLVLTLLILFELTVFECKLINIELLSSEKRENWFDGSKIKDTAQESKPASLPCFYNNARGIQSNLDESRQ